MTDEFDNQIPAAPKGREAERESEIAAGVYAGLTADTGIDEKAVRAVPVAGDRAQHTPPAAADAPVLVELRDVRQHFLIRKAKGKKATLKAVDGVSFSIYKGETFGLVGESGCGKSTLGKALLRLYPLTGGQVLFDGEDVSALKGKALRSFRTKAQMIFQDPSSCLNPRRRILDILMEPYAVHGLYTKEERREKAMELCDRVALPAPWPCSPSWWSATSRCRRWTYPFRRRSSTCWPICRRRWG